MFDKVISSILSSVGNELNKLGGILKLTPDFGRFAGVADILHRYTENVLGICCENGGCGGKASYTSIGINAAIDYFLKRKGSDASIVLIGADGACGEGVFNYIQEKKYNLVGVSDLTYSDKEIRGIPILESVSGQFSDDCLGSAEIIVATTIGNEFLNSNLDRIKEGAVVLLAHNDCLPINENSIDVLKKLQAKGIIVVPGQLLTFGGALTSRVEWYWRQAYKKEYFNN